MWHCGDIGDVAITDALAKRFKLRAVYGNIDGELLRRIFPQTEIFPVSYTHLDVYKRQLLGFEMKK